MYFLAPVESVALPIGTRRASRVLRHWVPGVRTSHVLGNPNTDSPWALSIIPANAPAGMIAQIRGDPLIYELPFGFSDRDRSVADIPASMRNALAARLEAVGFDTNWIGGSTQVSSILIAVMRHIHAGQRLKEHFPNGSPDSLFGNLASPMRDAIREMLIRLGVDISGIDAFSTLRDVRRLFYRVNDRATLLDIDASYSDTFTASNGTTVPNFTEDGSANWEINSNAVRTDTLAGSLFGKLRYNSVMDSVNFYSEVDVSASNSNTVGCGPAIRLAASSTVSGYFYSFYGTDASYVEEVTAGSGATLATGGAVGSGASISNARLSGDGNNLTGTRNGAADISTSDATFSTTSVGLMSFGAMAAQIASLDNWSAEDLVNSVVLPRVDYDLHPKAFLLG